MSIKRILTAGFMTAVVAGGGLALPAAAHAGDRPVGVAHVAAWSNIYLHKSGTITVSAGVKCSPGWESSDLSMQVNQGAAVGSGDVVADVPCDNAWHPVRFVISDIGGSFVPGAATTTSQILVNNIASGDSAGGHDQRAACIRRPHRTHATCPTS